MLAALAVAMLVAATSGGVAKDLVEPGPSLRYQRPSGPLLVTLPSGDVLAIGGNLRFGHYTEAERLSLGGRHWKSAGTVPSKDVGWLADAALLRDGRVLVIDVRGGSSLYDPARNLWRAGPPLTTVKGWAALAALADGTALASGGCCVDGKENALDVAEVYDPKLDRWTAVQPMHIGSVGHRLLALPDGRALAVGGVMSKVQHPAFVGGADVFDPRCGCWKAIGRSLPHNGNAITSVLMDGRVLFAGGQNAWNEPSTAAAILDPKTDTVTPAQPLPLKCIGHTAALLPDARVLVVCMDLLARPNILTFQPDRGTWEVLGSPRRDLFGATLAALPDGRALLVGGSGSKGTAAGVAIIDPRRGDRAK